MESISMKCVLCKKETEKGDMVENVGFVCEECQNKVTITSYQKEYYFNNTMNIQIKDDKVD